MKRKHAYQAPVAKPVEADCEPLMDLSNAQVPEGTPDIQVDNDPTDQPAGAKGQGTHSVWDD